ncbi:MAG: TolB family protein [Caldilineaceae bacterium]
MTNRSITFSAQSLAPQSAQWIRLSLRLLGLIAWLLLALLWVMTTGCRATAAAPTPTATVVPFPTFTPTPPIEPTATDVAVSPLPTALAATHEMQLWIAYTAEGTLWLWQAGASRKLTTVDGDSPIAISTGRQWIAFRRAGGLWAITADGEEERLLISGDAIAELPTAQPDYPRRLHHFAWLPYAHRLIWTTSLHTPDLVDPKSVVGPNYFLGLNHDLYSVDVDTAQITQLAAPDRGGLFYPSPDGAWIVTVAPDRINLLRTDGSGERRLLDLPAILTYSESPFYAKPLWADDSHSLMVAVPPKDALALAPEPTTIWQLWTNGRAPTQLAHFVTGSATVSIAPDLTRIAYAGRVNAQDPLTFHVANIDGADNRIFHTDNGGGFTEWLPDSAHFVYQADNGGATYLGHIDGRPPMPLGSYVMSSHRWVDAKQFLFIPYGTTPDATVGLWLGVINEHGVVETRMIAASATTFDFVRLPPAVTARPPRGPTGLITLPAPRYFLHNSG